MTFFLGRLSSRAPRTYKFRCTRLSRTLREYNPRNSFLIVFASRITPRPNRAQNVELRNQRRFGSQRKTHRNAIGKSMECQREGTGNLSESHRTVIGKSSKSRQKVIGKSSECHRNIIGMSWERHPRNARRFYAVSLENDILRHSRS